MGGVRRKALATQFEAVVREHLGGPGRRAQVPDEYGGVRLREVSPVRAEDQVDSVVEVLHDELRHYPPRLYLQNADTLVRQPDRCQPAVRAEEQSYRLLTRAREVQFTASCDLPRVR